MNDYCPSGGTFREVLAERLCTDPDEPLVTFYDDIDGVRIELSVREYARWASRAAAVLDHDIDFEVAGSLGREVRLDLATQWLGPVFLGGCWLAGVDVVNHHPEQLSWLGRNLAGFGSGPDAAVQILGPRELAADPDPYWEDEDGFVFGHPIRLLCSLDGGPLEEPLPDRVFDFGALWPAKPESYPGTPAEPDWSVYGSTGWDRLVVEAAASGVKAHERVLTDANPMVDQGVHLFVSTLVQGGSIVWVTNPQPGEWSERARIERTTRTVRAVSPLQKPIGPGGWRTWLGFRLSRE